jgi:hypothetical protein
MYPDQVARQQPASTTPMRDYLSSGPRPGTDQSYVVLPRALVENMPLVWQQQFTHLLAEFHQAAAHLNWPVYRVVPARRELLTDLDEEQLAEVGCIVEIDTDGELVYRERNGRRIENPEQTTALVSCQDPLPGEHRNATTDTPQRGVPAQQQWR